jgi:hypothetical protein
VESWCQEEPANVALYFLLDDDRKTTTMAASTKATGGGTAKRQRAVSPCPDDIIRCGRDIMHRDPFKIKASVTEEGLFRSIFGCAPIVALTVWTMLQEDNTLPVGTTMLHFLWSLCFLKVYGKQSSLLSLVGCPDEKTFRKWIWIIIPCIANMQPEVVSRSSFVCCTFVFGTHHYSSLVLQRQPYLSWLSL